MYESFSNMRATVVFFCFVNRDYSHQKKTLTRTLDVDSLRMTTIAHSVHSAELDIQSNSFFYNQGVLLSLIFLIIILCRLLFVPGQSIGRVEEELVFAAVRFLMYPRFMSLDEFARDRALECLYLARLESCRPKCWTS